MDFQAIHRTDQSQCLDQPLCPTRPAHGQFGTGQGSTRQIQQGLAHLQYACLALLGCFWQGHWIIQKQDPAAMMVILRTAACFPAHAVKAHQQVLAGWLDTKLCQLFDTFYL